MNLWLILWHSGIVVKLVLLVLIVLSVYSWAIVYYKWKQFKEIFEQNHYFLGRFRQLTQMSEMYQLSKELNASPLALIYQKGHEELQRLRERVGDDSAHWKELFAAEGTVLLSRAIKQAGTEAGDEMEDRLPILASVSSVAPFVGLFGTVWGIIDAFTGLSQGGGTIEAVAPGIAEALVATAVGLVAAIPANWFYNLYQAKIGKVNSQMEGFEQELLNLVERSMAVAKKKS